VDSYELYDQALGVSSVHCVVNGVIQPSNTNRTFNEAQFAQTTFVAGTGSSDTLSVQVTDQVLGQASGFKNFNVTVPTITPPTITVSDRTATAGEVVQASSPFSVSPSNRDTVARHSLFD